MKQHGYRMKWWGWGREGVSFDLAHRQGIVDYLHEKFAVKEVIYQRDFNWRDVVLNASVISFSVREKLQNLLGENTVFSDDYERIIHAYGKSYRDAIRLRSLAIAQAPDVVVYPTNGEDLVKILALCEELQIAVVPFGGGTSVVGGLEALPLAGGVICVDLARMNRLVAIDETALYARVEAGKFGPELEEELNLRGYTLGHFPQSFEFSTLGGWAATRSAGQNSTHYGKIEDLVIGLTMVTPRGVVVLPAGTHQACGPDMKNILIGSEGVLGIITELCVKVSSLPPKKKYVSYFFPDFASAFTASRELLQNGIVPALIRISDEEETESMIKLNRKPARKLKRVLYALGFSYFHLMGFGAGKRVLMMVGFEGSRKENERMHSLVHEVFRRYRNLYVGSSIGKSWLKDRFFLPYLRDDFLNNGILIDTLETATTWEKIGDLHHRVIAAISSAFSQQGVNFSVFAHISHLYKEGASLYFTFVANQQKGRELAQWHEVKKAASEAIVAFGAPISHHHGVGLDHREYFLAALGEREKALLASLKNAYDPAGIMNPGKLL
ncbi:MAG: FAD-binding oxidoreductase [Deltaproteobacteria bacterium]|nr:FAD-binding oxidoreductase [Deltaproteobacteria bacterium]